MPLPNDVERIAKALANLESSSTEYTGSKSLAAKRLIRHSKLFEKTAADAMASTTTAHTASPGMVMPCAGRLLGAYFVPHGSATADNTNNATLQVEKSDGAGGSATVMASKTTNVAGTGNLAAGVKKALTLSATEANTRFAKGDLIAPSITKAGTGVVVPIGSWQIDYEEEGTDDYGAG